MTRHASAPGRIVPFVLDITDPKAVADTARLVVAELGPIDLAILNAGTYVPTPAHAFDRATVAKLVDVNLMGTVNCLEVLLPRFLVRGGGEIAVVASMTGYRGLPTAAGYGATKAALINLSEALRPELELGGVSLRLINPGFVDTPLTRLNEFPMPFMISSRRAAETIVRGIRTSRFEITAPRRMAVLMKLLRILPNRLFLTIVRRVTPKPPGGLPSSDKTKVIEQP